MKHTKNTVKSKLMLAKRLGLSRSTLDTYLARPGAPERGPDGWHLEQAAAFISSNARAESTATKTNDNIAKLKAREIGLRCERLQMRLEQERGVLVEKSKIVQFFMEFANEFRGQLHQVLENEYPTAVAGMDPPQARILGKRLADKLDEIALRHGDKLQGI